MPARSHSWRSLWLQPPSGPISTVAAPARTRSPDSAHRPDRAAAGHPRRAIPPKLRERDYGTDLRHAVATALLAGADRNRLPMLHTPEALDRIEAHHTVFGCDWHQPPNAELVASARSDHAFAARNALQQRQPQRATRARWGAAARWRPVRGAFDRQQLGRVLTTLAIEEYQGRTGAQPQHGGSGAWRPARAARPACRRERRIEIDAGQPHVASSMPSVATSSARSISAGLMT